jgi:hypothetical protein
MSSADSTLLYASASSSSSYQSAGTSSSRRSRSRSSGMRSSSDTFFEMSDMCVSEVFQTGEEEEPDDAESEEQMPAAPVLQPKAAAVIPTEYLDTADMQASMPLGHGWKAQACICFAFDQNVYTFYLAYKTDHREISTLLKVDLARMTQSELLKLMRKCAETPLRHSMCWTGRRLSTATNAPTTTPCDDFAGFGEVSAFLGLTYMLSCPNRFTRFVDKDTSVGRVPRPSKMLRWVYVLDAHRWEITISSVSPQCTQVVSISEWVKRERRVQEGLHSYKPFTRDGCGGGGGGGGVPLLM